MSEIVDLKRELLKLRWERINITKMFLSKQWDNLQEEERAKIKAKAEEIDKKIDRINDILHIIQ